MTLNTICGRWASILHQTPTSLVASTNNATIIHMYIPFIYIYICQSSSTYICMHVCTYLASRTRIFLTGPVLILGHEFTWGIIGLHRWSQISCFPLLTTQSRTILNRPTIRTPTRVNQHPS
jgi:hypothetical protein